MTKIQRNNENQVVNSENIINESPEHNAVNNQALDLISEIVKLPDVVFIDRQRFTEEKIYYKYLEDIPDRVQSIINTAYVLNDYSGTLSKAKILHNFLTMAFERGMSFSNPFNVFTLQTRNYDKLLRNEF